MFIAFLSICIFLLQQCKSASGGFRTLLPPPVTNDTALIIVGFRHGYRNPAQFFKNDTMRKMSGWGWEGASQLTNIGKQQAYSLGKFLRNRYSKVLPAEFQVAEVKATSSSAERCQMTLQCVMAGAFPPSGRAIWERSLMWQPIPFSINDPLLRMYNVKCPTYTRAYQPISDDNIPQSRQWLREEDKLVKYIAKNTGFNGSLSDLSDVTDNVQSILYTPGARMPAWIENPSLPGFNKEKLIKEILEYAEAHQIQCAVDRPCAKAMAGLWLDEILKIFKQKEQGKIPERKANFYAAHTETVLSLMKLLGMDVKETPTSAGFILEYRKSGPGTIGQIRALFHEPNPKDPKIRVVHVVRLPYCSRADWCPLNVVEQAAVKETFSDWQEFCQLPRCPVL